MKSKYGLLADEFISICTSLGHSIRPNSRILEVGCGSGDFVYEMRAKGFEIYGADLKSYGYRVRDDVLVYFRPIRELPYRLDFDSQQFDFVFTNQVFEHVKNKSALFSEISRVLKTQGVSINVFPSKYRLIEPHIKVPLAGVFQSIQYLNAWAILGLRTSAQVGLPWRVVSAQNKNLLLEKIDYQSPRSIINAASRYFERVDFFAANRLDLGHGRASRYLGGLNRRFKFANKIYGLLHTHIVCCYK